MTSGPDVDCYLLEQLEEKLSGLKLELFDVSRSILALSHDTTVQAETESKIPQGIFDACLRIRRLLSTPTPVTFPTVTHEGGRTKLPQIAVPTFDGRITEWRTFWEQYEIAIHGKPYLSNPEKLAYLQQSPKDSPAWHTIKRHSGSGNDYAKAGISLNHRYDRPHFLHRVHVRAIMEVPILKEGNDKELHCLHNVLSQHLQELKVMKYELSGPFITSLIETKLDQATSFEWQ